MYPSNELKQLALRKQVLLVQSALLRAQWATAGTELAGSIKVAEGWVATLKKVFPYLSFASQLFTGSKSSRGSSWWSLAWKWAPTIFQAFKWFKASRPSASSLNPKNKYPLYE